MYLATFTANGTVFTYVVFVVGSVTLTVTLPLVQLTSTVWPSTVTLCFLTLVIVTTPVSVPTVAPQFMHKPFL